MSITPQMVDKAMRGLESERTVEDLASYVGCTRAQALDILDYMTRTGRAVMSDYQKRKWTLKHNAKAKGVIE